jgi:hypothetical protein
MAIIDFQVGLFDGAGDSATEESLHGSGLGFFGLTAGSSVQIGSYQDTTFVSNGDGSVTKTRANNIKYVADTFPSGMCTVGAAGGGDYTVGLSGVKSAASTLGIRFGHATAVKTQNVQLRIYDRTNINNPASGVNTKVAEIVNFNGSAFNTQGSTGGSSSVVGSGDAFWWGEAWPAAYSSRNYAENSLGVRFYNGLDSDSVVNPDQRLSDPTAFVTDNDLTVGGSGVIVPLLDSPGSGQKGLAEILGTEGMIWPKWTQYLNTTAQTNVWGGNFGDGLLNDTNKGKCQGGTGYHTHHTWAVALSASPLNIGSKEQYGLYVSLEYL